MILDRSRGWSVAASGLRRVGLAALLACLAVSHPATVLGSRGVAVDLGSIEVDEPLVAGVRYALPPVTVRNPGTEAARYRMGSRPSSEAPAPDAAWFSFEPMEFTLLPGQRQEVAISLRAPSDVPGGRFEGLITAELIGTGVGAQVGAAAAVRVRLSIGSGGLVQEVIAQLGRTIDRWFPWSVIVPLALVLLAGAAVAVRAVTRRYAVRIERR